VTIFFYENGDKKYWQKGSNNQSSSSSYARNGKPKVLEKTGPVPSQFNNASSHRSAREVSSIGGQSVTDCLAWFYSAPSARKLLIGALRHRRLWRHQQVFGVTVGLAGRKLAVRKPTPPLLPARRHRHVISRFNDQQRDSVAAATVCLTVACALIVVAVAGIRIRLKLGFQPLQRMQRKNRR